jgi:hypothetical protein
VVVLTDSKSSAHKKFSADLRKKHARKGTLKVKMRDEQVSVESLMAKQEELDKQADKEKKQREVASAGARVRRGRNQGFSSAFIEEGMSGDEENGDGSRMRGYSDDDDDRTDRLRAAKEESEEDEVDFEEDEGARVRGREVEAQQQQPDAAREEEEEIIEEEDMVPQRKAKRRKLNVGEESDDE